MKKSFHGIVSADGKLKIYDTTSFNGFLGEQKGKRILISLETEDSKATIFTQNYFRKVICGEFIEIFKKQYGEHTSEEIASMRLRLWCPVPRKEGNLVELEEMSQEELAYLIKHSKMIASKEFDHYIND